MEFPAQTAMVGAALGSVILIAALGFLGVSVTREQRRLIERTRQIAADSEKLAAGSERQFLDILEQLPDAVLLVDGQGNVCAANPPAAGLFGCLQDAMSGQPRERFLSRDGDAWRGHLPSGQHFPAELRESSVRLGGATMSLLFVRDLAAHAREEQLEAIIRGMTQRVLQGQSLEAIAPWLCARIVETFPLVSAWIGTKQPDGSIEVLGGTPEVVDAIRAYGPRWDEQRTGQGPSGEAVRRGKTCTAHVDNWPNIPSLVEPRALGYRLIVSVPLTADKEVVGLFSALTTADSLSQETMHRLDVAGERLGLALRIALDQRTLRLQAAAMDAAANAIFITDRDGRIQWVNEAFTRLSGFASEEVIGKTPRLLKSGAQDESFYAQLWATLRLPEVWRGELIERRRDGTLYTVEQTVTPMLDTAGQVTHFVVVHEDITARRRAEERIKYLSNHDPLTTLPNRQMFRDRLRQALERSGGRTIGVFLLDLENFSRINDALGHDIGDRLLVAVVDRLNIVARGCEMLARVGGDEFGLLYSGVSGTDAAAQIAARLLSALAEPVQIEDHEMAVGAAIGIAFHPGDAETADELLKNAETAMYRAVREVPNGFRFFSNQMNEDSRKRLVLERGLRNAIPRGELLLHYQPQLDVLTGRIVGVEALVRWQHREHGLVPPGEFIPLAEENGLILPIGEWVLREACRQLDAWRRDGLGVVPVAVNLSAVQLRQPDLCRSVQATLNEFGIAPELIEIELTESAVMQDAETAEAVLRDLRAAGLRLAVDDFGTGYSSLSYLKRFPLDRLKIDRSFVRDLSTDPNDAAIARAIITLGHSLGLVVVSEGVEEERQLAYLRAQGCDVVQGFLFSPPVPAAKIAEMLSQRNVATL